MPLEDPEQPEITWNQITPGEPTVRMVLERNLQAYSKIKSQNQLLKRRVVKKVSKNMGRRRKVPKGSATPKVPKTSVSQPQGLERQTNQDMFRDKLP